MTTADNLLFPSTARQVYPTSIFLNYWPHFSTNVREKKIHKSLTPQTHENNVAKIYRLHECASPEIWRVN